jgi:hypothetical protein
LAVNFDGGKYFTHTNQITLWTSAQDQVSNVIANAHQLFSRIASHSCAICFISLLLLVLPSTKISNA